jgi:hypothetical protein
MKIPASLSKLPELILRPLVLLGRGVVKIWFAIFGRFSWSPPGWFSQSRSGWSRFSDAHVRIDLELEVVSKPSQTTPSFRDGCDDFRH